MATLLVGDVHGCYHELRALLQQADFQPERDTLWLTGDLVSRGDDSLAVLRYLYSHRSCVKVVLGNHDLHLLAVYAGVSRSKPRNNLSALLNAPDVDELINWLRKQNILLVDESLRLVMCHAGITPQWDLNTAMRCGRELESVLRSACYPLFLDAMYGDYPCFWQEDLNGLSRLRFSANVFTRMRYCFTTGELDLQCRNHPDQTPKLLSPWFNLPSPVVMAGYSIAFGHWASLARYPVPKSFYPLDTGCCWGEALTLLRWEDKRYFIQPALSQRLS